MTVLYRVALPVRLQMTPAFLVGEAGDCGSVLPSARFKHEKRALRS